MGEETREVFSTLLALEEIPCKAKVTKKAFKKDTSCHCQGIHILLNLQRNSLSIALVTGQSVVFRIKVQDVCSLHGPLLLQSLKPRGYHSTVPWSWKSERNDDLPGQVAGWKLKKCGMLWQWWATVCVSWKQEEQGKWERRFWQGLNSVIQF